MLRSLKKALFIIPCMVMAFFLFNGVSALAKDAYLTNSTKVAIGDESRENTYYFTSSPSWTIYTKSNIITDYDTFLRYRVINPNGKATAWSDKQYYPDTKDKFTINDFNSLLYTEDVDLSTRTSIAKDVTYYVELKYYSSFLHLIDSDQNKDEVVKIIVPSTTDELNIPNLKVTYNDSTNKFDVVVNFMDSSNNETSTGVITSISYFFTNEEKIMSTTLDFKDEFDAAADKGYPTFTPGSKVITTFEKPSTSYKYVYVMAETGNGNYTTVKYDINTKGTDVVDQDKNDDTNNNSGLFDYKAGELILLVLVVVLIVSCALIITQKIVDYKKKLY